MVLPLQNVLSARSHRGESGQGLVEYALILILVAIVVVAMLTLFGEELNSAFSEVIDAFPG